MENRDIELRAKINQCVRCGQCRAICPIFREQGVEAPVARGRPDVLQSPPQGKAAEDGELAAVLTKCLLCKACAKECPGGS